MKSFSLKAILAAAAVTLSAAGAQAAVVDNIALTSFSAGTYTLNLNGDGSGTIGGFASTLGSAITSITLDGVAFSDLTGGNFAFNAHTYSGNTHVLQVIGTGSILFGNLSYNDSVTGASLPLVSGVPEPETLAMMLAGLVMVGSMARRRRFKG